MKTLQSKLNIQASYPLMTPHNWEDIIFFDIETTGFSAYTSYLYLIGCMYYEDNTWQMTQWLADDMNSEVSMLEAFFQTLKSYKRLVHFNGSGFDIPFILQKCKQHHLDYTFEDIENFDIYKKLIPFKKLLPLPNYKLKTIEKFVGINREDSYSGEDLIQIYANYLGRLQYEKLLQKNIPDKNIKPKASMIDSISRKETDHTKNLSAEELSRLFLLHNLEDVKGLLKVSEILFYADLFEKDIANVLFQEENTVSPTQALTPDILINGDETITSSVSFHFTLGNSLPQPVTLYTPLPSLLPEGTEDSNRSNHDFSLFLKLSENRLTLTLPIYQGELKYFYDNYRDYFYLPKEDTAIHKSVAQYVDKDFKVKAKPATCYSKKYGHYIPQAENLFTPYFKNSFADKLTYFELSNPGLNEPDRFQDYINSLLHFILHNKGTQILT